MALVKILELNDSIQVQVIAHQLELSGICVEVFNLKTQNLGLASGAIFTPPSLWVEEDDVNRAQAFIKHIELLASQHKGNEKTHGAWVCANCHETSEGSFSACWKCGSRFQA